jgi:tetratricopeptide (TPR) repeat protein
MRQHLFFIGSLFSFRTVMKRILCIVFAFLMLLKLHAQKLELDLIQLTKEYKESTVDSTKLKAMLLLSEYHTDKDFSESKRLLNEAFLFLDKPENKNFQSEKAKAYAIQGIIDRRMGNYVNSIENYIKSKTLYEALNDSINTSSLLHNIGVVHRYLKEYKTSITYYKESIQLKKLLPNQTYEIACGYNMMGVSYNNLKKRDSALWCYDKANTLFKSIHKEEDIYRVNANIAVIYSIQKKYKEALALYNEGMTYYKKMGNEVSLSNSYYNISSLYKRKSEYKIAMQYADSCLVIAKREGLNDRRATALLRKSFLYSKFNEYEQAYEYYRKFNRASDSIFNIENAKKIQALELNYKFQQEKREVQLLADNESAKKKIYFILFVITLFLSAIIAFLVKRDFKYKKRLLQLENKTLLQEKEQITNAFNKLKNSTNAEERIKAKQEILKLKILTENDWVHFRDKFELLYPDFLSLLKDSDFQFTKSETRLLILKKLDIETKEIADMTGVSNDSVLKTQYRLRKKLVIDKVVDIIHFLEHSTEN